VTQNTWETDFGKVEGNPYTVQNLLMFARFNVVEHLPKLSLHCIIQPFSGVFRFVMVLRDTRK